MDQNNTYDLIIVGGGIVGLASAYEIQKRHKDLNILILEKERQLAMHQTGRNSGVIHSGLYYKPGSHRARNCKRGRRKLVEFCKENNIPHDICGKIVVATERRELPVLDRILSNGVENNIEGIEKIDSHQIREIEPHCVSGISAIWVPYAGIVDFRQVALKLAELVCVINPSSRVLTNRLVKQVVKHEKYSEIITSAGVYKGRNTVFCSGLFSDRTANMDGLKSDVRIVGFRGDYYELTEQGLGKVRNLIYPVPDPAFPFLGVHFTRMINGGVECGPNAVFTFKREGYHKLAFDLRDTWEALTFPGTLKLFSRHWRVGVGEYARAFSKTRFLRSLQKLIPSLVAEDIEPSRSGVRATAIDSGGGVIEDFVVEHSDNSIHVLNAPSPAATSCLAIGETICEIAEKRFWENR